MIPFSPEVFFALFEEYNLAIWPAQLVAYGLGLLALALVFKPSVSGSAIIGAILAVFWLWNGVVYHWMFFAPINFAAPVFAALFVLEALLLIWRFVIRRDLMFEFRRDFAGSAGVTLMIFALTVYPLLGLASGHGWPQSASFGVAPSPTVIFSFGAFILARPHMPVFALVVPFIWVLIGGSAIWLIGIPEDVLLPAAGLVTLLLFVRRKRHLT